jgi:glyoxylase-like metal-dependent hydrolase (beta-lactamase superfamily II)
MRVFNLTGETKVYTCNCWLVLGNHSTIQDRNTLIDVGRDPKIFEALMKAPTGVGKRKVDQIILTHSHYDHVELLSEFIEKYHPIVYAFTAHLKGVDQVVKDGDRIPIGDGECEILHTPGHSQDSICVYVRKEGLLFNGDTPIQCFSDDQQYDASFIEGLRKLSNREIRIAYPGHGNALSENIGSQIHSFIKVLEQSKPHRP